MNLRPGCWNKPRVEEGAGYWLQTRAYCSHSGRYVPVDEWIEDRFSRECHHDSLYTDCTGCEWRKK